MKKCQFCAEEIQDEAIKCRFCGEFLDRKETNSIPAGYPSPLTRAGVVFITLALLLGLYFFVIFDPSVQVPGVGIFGLGNRVNNLGLLSQQQNGIIIACTLAVIGIGAILAGKNSPGKRLDLEVEESPSVTEVAEGPERTPERGLGFYIALVLVLIMIAAALTSIPASR
jgi:hypothetical protein